MNFYTTESWDRMSKFYDKSWPGYHCKRVSPFMVKVSDLNSKDKVLEIGAGTGALTSYVCQMYQGINITATDVSPDMCKILQSVKKIIELIL